MASLSKKKTGGWLLQFVGLDKKRRSVGIPKCTKKTAEKIRFHVETIIACGITGEPLDRETAEWIRDLHDDLHSRLAKVGLVEARKSSALGPFVKQYIAKRVDVAPRTTINLQQAERSLIQFFGKDRRIESITEEDARDYRIWLESKTGGKLAEATAARRCKRAKQFLEAARRSKLIVVNPFDGVAMGSQRNADRLYYVEPEVVERIIKVCPNTRWKLIVSLCRFAALRCPSELTTLKWANVLWAEKRMAVFSQKTGTTRVIPIWPRVRPHLEQAFVEAPDGAELVFPDLDGASNLRTTFEKLIIRSGQEPWPRLFQNLRASGATDIANQVRSHTAAAWCGHSEMIALAHYRSVVEEDFERVTEEPAGSALQNALHFGSELDGRAAHEKPQDPCFAESCGPMPPVNKRIVPPEGLEPSTL